MNDLFYFIEEGHIANYADDSTYHAIKDSIMELLKTLEKETYSILNWFSFNEMKSNDDKCHLIVANECKRSYQSNNFIYLRNTFLEGEDLVKLLGLQVEEDLSIETHLNSVIKKGNQKLHALVQPRSQCVGFSIRFGHRRTNTLVYSNICYENLVQNTSLFCIKSM